MSALNETHPQHQLSSECHAVDPLHLTAVGMSREPEFNQILDSLRITACTWCKTTTKMLLALLFHSFRV